MIGVELLLAAISLVESGNNDYAIGRAGEVSRYQIKRSVWKTHRKKDDWSFPEASFQVARDELSSRISTFKSVTGRSPDAKEVMALWNAPGKFAKMGYCMCRMPAKIRDRCERFENIVRLLGGKKT